MSSLRIGVLAVQGAFAEHIGRLRALGCDAVEIRQRADLSDALDGIVLPGGESTAQSKLLHKLGMMQPLRALIDEGLPVFGTCAGMILLAEEVLEGDGRPSHPDRKSDGAFRGAGRIDGIRTMPMIVQRNGYGRQLGSFHTVAPFAGYGDIPMTFIRAPFITEVRGGAEALAEVGGRIVAARSGNQLATAFHPELDDCNAVHDLFLDICQSR